MHRLRRMTDTHSSTCLLTRKRRGERMRPSMERKCGSCAARRHSMAWKGVKRMQVKIIPYLQSHRVLLDLLSTLSLIGIWQ